MYSSSNNNNCIRWAWEELMKGMRKLQRWLRIKLGMGWPICWLVGCESYADVGRIACELHKDKPVHTYASPLSATKG